MSAKKSAATKSTTTKKAPAKATATKPATESTPTKPAKATTKKAEIARDTFGCRQGSQAAAINANLSKKAISVDDIANKTGLDKGRIRAHLKSLLDKSLAKETEAGFTVA